MTSDSQSTQGTHADLYAYFYHDCNILTNRIAQKEVDKSHMKPIYQSVIAALAYKVIKWAE